jgi:acylaminoacyl-peptidase
MQREVEASRTSAVVVPSLLHSLGFRSVIFFVVVCTTPATSLYTIQPQATFAASPISNDMSLEMTADNSNELGTLLGADNDGYVNDDSMNDAVAYHKYASMAVDLSNGNVASLPGQNEFLFTTIRSVRDVDQNLRRKFVYTVPFSTTGSVSDTGRTLQGLPLQIPPQELLPNILLRLPSPSGKLIAIFCEQLNDVQKADTTTTVLEIWDNYGMTLTHRIELSQNLHRNIVCGNNGVFGMPSWNVAETLLIYVAEEASIVTKSFFDGKAYNSAMIDKKNHPTVVGGQHVMGIGKAEHHGEKYAQQSPHHGLFCVNVQTGKVGKIENVPDPKTITLGQPVFYPRTEGKNSTVEESIVYTGWGSKISGIASPTRRLGLVYCQQRPSQLYYSNISNLVHRLSKGTTKLQKVDIDSALDPPYIALTTDMKISFSPRFALINDSSNTSCNLVFLTSQHGFETHSGCFALGKIDLSTVADVHSSKTALQVTDIIVEEIWDPCIKGNHGNKYYGTVAGMHFPGLFLQQLPPSCFISPEYLVTTTQWGSCQKIVCISVITGCVHLIEIKNNCHPHSSDEILCCNSEVIVVSVATPGMPATVHYLNVDQILQEITMKQQPIHVYSTNIGTFSPIASSKIVSNADKVVRPSSEFNFEIKEVPAEVVDGVTCSHGIQSILILPRKAKDTVKTKTSEVLPPMIVIPHGGPHSAAVTKFVASYSFLCGYGGYAVLLVNYRGSTGFGQASIQSLPTKIGTLDVQDVITATNNICSSGLVDSNRIGICGGSHGGFLTAHLTGKYPTMFRAAVMRNPVVNLPAMVTSTDIPDWCHVEACGTYNFDTYKPATLNEIQAFYEVSPIQYAQNVQTPTLIALGLKDLRVPPSQGLEWYHALRSCTLTSPRPPTKLLLYENDDHAIDGVASEADHWVHIKQWFDQYLLK